MNPCPSTHRSARSGLPKLPAEIAVAGKVDEALQFVDAGRYALVITDVRMDPGAFFRPIQTAGGFRTGIFLAREIQKRQPRARIIALSSWDDPDVHQWFTQNATVAFMQKPPDLRRLANLARGMLHPKRQLPQVFILPMGSGKPRRFCRKSFSSKTLATSRPCQGPSRNSVRHRRSGLHRHRPRCAGCGRGYPA